MNYKNVPIRKLYLELSRLSRNIELDEPMSRKRERLLELLGTTPSNDILSFYVPNSVALSAEDMLLIFDDELG